ncbi:hypothetical protein [Pseudomonas chlororaphis]|uniref:hypothetical protein n=1 Tax=Pseudomonas chlororaphis TaxID=587753 RepID=UPI0023680CB5|nr:hypothetical protein [Pseudomonas chlororaphis]WDH37428.1 hypothetical protein PUP62_11570 [Pseudomonas chlororaphis]WDH43515.1 hypothetical protein PUP51_11575 [Pseudomonas chlororaphis]
MDYVIGGREYSASYQDLREEHARFTGMTDKRFLKELPAALHFAVFVCRFKELPASVVLSDEGIVHQLAHLIHLRGEPLVTARLGEIRELFNKQLQLIPITRNGATRPTPADTTSAGEETQRRITRRLSTVVSISNWPAKSTPRICHGREARSAWTLADGPHTDTR